MRLSALIILTILSCSTPKTSESLISKDTTTNTQATLLIPNSMDSMNPLDSLSYVGYIERFPDNNSFYTNLYFVDNFNYNLYDEVAKMGNEIIFEDEETKRTKIPIKTASQYFNLTGLTNISIYNKENIRLAIGQLSHIEFVEDMIENKFVAVFNVDNTNMSDYLFCIGNSKGDLTTIQFDSFKDERLDSELINHLKLTPNNIWIINHYKLNDEAIFSTVSADTTGFIIKTVDKTHRILYKSKFNETINGLTIISKEINGQPIILTDCGMSETDMLWTSVLIFNGTDYEIIKDHRVRD